MEPLLLTIAETAEAMRVTPRTVKTWVARGIIPSIKVGDEQRSPRRIPVDALKKWIEERMEG